MLLSSATDTKMSDMEEGELSDVEFEPEQRPKVLPSPSFPAERPIAVARHRLDRGQGMRITFANTSTELPVSNLIRNYSLVPAANCRGQRTILAQSLFIIHLSEHKLDLGTTIALDTFPLC